MLLTRLVLEDVGVYGGSHEFDLKTTPERPIVLYGGTNGAGKTTLFESILLCLYGADFAGTRMPKKQYHQKIHGMLHRNSAARTSAPEASVTLEFQQARNGKIRQYKIRREWCNDDGKITESLTMHKMASRGKRYSKMDMEEAQIQSMIGQMIPKAIAGMFFFDGEKIRNLAGSDDEGAYIRSSFDALLGLDVPARLYDDIGLYMLRNSGPDNSASADLDQATQDKEDAEKKLGRLQEKRVFLDAEIGRMERNLEGKESRFFQMGGAFAKNRQSLLAEKADLDRITMLHEGSLRSLIEGDLPLAILSDQLEDVAEELRSDTAKIKASFEKDTLDSAFAHVIREMDVSLDSYESETKRGVMERLSEITDEKLRSISGKQKTTFDFSLSEMASMQERIGQLLSQDYAHIHGNYDLYKESLEKRRDVTAKLDVAPQQDEVGPLYSEIKEATISIGEMRQELAEIERLEAQEKSLITLANSKIRNLLSKAAADKRQTRGANMIPKIQNVLEDYSERLRRKKIRLLESNISEGMRKCLHKDGLVSGVSIDLRTYEITMYGKNGDVVPREKLSQGERQMSATAIVWGLAKTSGRPLPFVIDTPLARLDERHRANLVSDFYPEASHQTIIFSTDTEITGEYHAMLEPYIYAEALITYDEKRDVSFTRSGYFDGGQMIEA